LIKKLLDTGVLKEIPDQMIVNEYLPGQGINPHIDNVGYFADGIASVSLGSAVIMDFIYSYDPSVISESKASETVLKNFKKEVLLTPRSVISLHGEARYKWRHGIVARKSDHKVPRGRRVSLTFRKMK
jgi:alkylated DNA repair dioxygenase AlkB